MNLDEYKREIELMKKQNFTEYDMYSIVAALIRSGSNIKSLSLRDISNRTRSPRGQVFYGLSSFPELVILDEDFQNSDNDNSNVDNRDKIYGCIEIKMINFNLLSVEKIKDKVESIKQKLQKSLNVKSDENKKLTPEEGQILGEVLWYRKVIYTNGLIWKFYECKYIDGYEDNIKNLVKKRINEYQIDKKSTSTWYEDLDFEKIEFREQHIVDITKIDNKQWEEFIEKLHEINWKKQGFNSFKK